MIRRIVAVRGGLPEEGKRRLAQVEALFGETEADPPGSSKQHKLPVVRVKTY